MMGFNSWDEDDNFENFEKFRKAPKAGKGPNLRKSDHAIREARKEKEGAKQAAMKDIEIEE